MIETRRLKNVIILMEAILSFVLSRKIIVKIVLAFFLKKRLHVSQKKTLFHKGSKYHCELFSQVFFFRTLFIIGIIRVSSKLLNFFVHF